MLFLLLAVPAISWAQPDMSSDDTNARETVPAPVDMVPGAGSSTKDHLKAVAAPGYDVPATDSTTLVKIIAILINVFLGLLGIIFIVLVIFSGYNWMTAAGDPKKVEKAQDTLREAIIGLVIIVGVFAIWNFIDVFFLKK